MRSWPRPSIGPRARRSTTSFPAAAYDDPVGDWYEAALPSRFAFCMRDVSHQATGAHVLGLAAFNRNMLGKFARAISPSRDFCSYWEIDKWDRPAPVDYKSDRDFWYNLTANFDVLDACWRQYLWTGDRTYLDDPAFRDFYRLSVGAYVEAWDKDRDGVPEHRPEYGSRGLGGYDEGPFSDRALYASDLIAAMARAFDDYAAMLEARNESAAAGDLRERAEALRKSYEGWWSEATGQYADGRVQGGALVFQDLIWNGVFPLYFGFVPPGPRRDTTLRRIRDAEPEGIEIESYLPEIFYRYGEDEAAYARILALADPAKERREYPEVPFAVVGAVATGLMGVGPDARTRTVETRSALHGRDALGRVEEPAGLRRPGRCPPRREAEDDVERALGRGSGLAGRFRGSMGRTRGRRRRQKRDARVWMRPDVRSPGSRSRCPPARKSPSPRRERDSGKGRKGSSADE